MTASKIAMKEIDAEKESIIKVLSQVLEEAQVEEEVVIYLNNEDLKFIEEVMSRGKKKFDFLKKVRLEPNEDVTRGGCLLETKFGVIDASISQRFDRIWEAFERKMPKLKSHKKAESTQETKEQVEQTENEKMQADLDVDKTGTDDEGSSDE